MSDKKSEKKRKRQAEQGELPNKKAGGGDAKDKRIKLNIVQEESYGRPAIVSSNGIKVPRDIHMKAYIKENDHSTPSGSISSSKSPKPFDLLLYSDSHPKLNYIAANEPSSSVGEAMKHYVGVYDPQTGDLEIFDAQRLTLKTTVRSEIEEVIENRESSRRGIVNVMDKRDELGKAFGTKKTQKAIAARSINAISSQRGAGSDGPIPTDAVAEAVLDSIKDSVGDMPTREELQAIVDEAKPRPKANLNATVPKDVYKIKTLIPREILDGMDVTDWEASVEKNEGITTTSRFVSGRIVRFSEETRKLKALRYLLALIEFHSSLRILKTKGRKLPKREDLKKKMEASEDVLNSIRKQFSTGGEMTKWQYDHLVTHIAAIAISIDDCKTDTYELREDLRLDTKQIVQYFREIGCFVGRPTDEERKEARITAAESGDHQYARLKLPLVFPKQRVIRQKR